MNRWIQILSYLQILDIYSDESTMKSEYGEVLQINTDNDQIKEILHNLFYDIVNIEFNL